MSENIKLLSKAIEPYYSLLMMLGFFITLFIAAYNIIISPSDLTVNVSQEKVNFPSGLAEDYDQISQYMIKSKQLTEESITIYNYLIKTTESKEIVLRNTSSKTLRGVKFKHLNVDDLTAWSISSDFLTNSEEKLLQDNLTHDQTRQIVYSKNDIELPPNSQINIKLWGSFESSFLENNIIANYDGGDAHFEKSYEITGLKGYVFNYSFEFLVIMIIIFIAVYYVGIKSIKNAD